MSAPFAKLPNWAEYGLIPVINLVVAFLISGLVVVFAGDNPFKAAYLMVSGAFGSGEGIGPAIRSGERATVQLFTGAAINGEQIERKVHGNADVPVTIS